MSILRFSPLLVGVISPRRSCARFSARAAGGSTAALTAAVAVVVGACASEDGIFCCVDTELITKNTASLPHEFKLI